MPRAGIRFLIQFIAYMTQSSGQLNRRLVDYYLRKMTKLGYDFTICTAMAANGKVMEE